MNLTEKLNLLIDTIGYVMYPLCFAIGYVTAVNLRKPHSTPIKKTAKSKDERFCTLQNSRGYVFLHMPDGQRVPGQIDFSMDQPMDEYSDKKLAKAIVTVYCKVIDTVEVA